MGNFIAKNLKENALNTFLLSQVDPTQLDSAIEELPDFTVAIHPLQVFRLMDDLEGDNLSLLQSLQEQDLLSSMTHEAKSGKSERRALVEGIAKADRAIGEMERQRERLVRKVNGNLVSITPPKSTAGSKPSTQRFEECS